MSHSQRRTILAVFPAFAIGGAQLRLTTLINHFGDRYRFRIVSLNGDTAALASINPSLLASMAEWQPGANPAARLLAMHRLLAAERPDLLITHNWGSIEWTAAARLARLAHVHIEDGFGPEERDRQLPRRVLARRVALRQATVILPSMTLLRLARDVWRLPPERLRYLPNGVDLAHFTPAPPRPPDPVFRVGIVAALRPEKNIARLIRAVARVPDTVLTVVGEGSERHLLEALAIERRATVRFLGGLRDPRSAYAAMDVFALSSDTEQMPLTVLEAMASGLAIVATDVGDIRSMVAAANGPCIVPRDEAALAAALTALASDAGARAALGAANRAKAEAEFGFERMAASYAALFDGQG